MGFEKWQATAAEMKEEERKLRQAVMRMVARQMAAGFGTVTMSCASEASGPSLAFSATSEPDEIIQDPPPTNTQVPMSVEVLSLIHI